MSIYTYAGVPESDEKALHATGNTSWDCPRCGQDPEDCWCESPGLDPKPWKCLTCSDRFVSELYRSGAERTRHRVTFAPRAEYVQEVEEYRGN